MVFFRFKQPECQFSMSYKLAQWEKEVQSTLWFHFFPDYLLNTLKTNLKHYQKEIMEFFHDSIWYCAYNLYTADRYQDDSAWLQARPISLAARPTYKLGPVTCSAFYKLGPFIYLFKCD